MIIFQTGRPNLRVIVTVRDTSGPRHADIQQSAAELGIKIVRWDTVIILIVIIIIIIIHNLLQ